MKHNLLICLMMAAAAIFVGGCDVDMDFINKADNPDYAAWKGFPIGSGFEFEGMVQYSAEDPRRINITSELMVFDLTQAMVKRDSEIFNPGAASEIRSEDVNIPSRVKKMDNPLTQPDVHDDFKGWDSVLIGEKLYDCEVHYYIVKHDAERLGVKTQGLTGMKMWQCKKIPGGIAKLEMISLSPDRLFMLSGQVVKVNMGMEMTPRRPAKEYKPAPAAPKPAAPVAPVSENNTPEPEKTVTAPSSMPVMPEPDKKMQTAGLNTVTDETTAQNETSPKVILPSGQPAVRKSDPILLSEEEELQTQPTTDTSLAPNETVAPKELGSEAETD